MIILWNERSPFLLSNIEFGGTIFKGDVPWPLLHGSQASSHHGALMVYVTGALNFNGI
jgi:hypothetical protein